MTTKSDHTDASHNLSDHDLLTRLYAMCASRCEKVEKHEGLLNGNGRLGLKSKVAIMWWGLGIAVGIGATVAGGLFLQHFSG